MPTPKLSDDLAQQAIELLEQHGSINAASKAANIPRNTLRNRLRHAAARGMATRLQTREALQGVAPEFGLTHPVPSPFHVKGVSTYYTSHGEITGQWVKTALASQEHEQAIREFVKFLAEDATGKSPLQPAPAYADEDLLAVYPMGDPHFGMYAWAAEVGEDFNLDEAESLTVAAIDRLVASAPSAHTALIIELGDFFHTDTESNQTLRSHNALDVDTRWARVMQVGLRAMVHVINRTLEKHVKVIVRIVKGNHDSHSSFALALALDAYFSNNERVKIDLSPAVFWYYHFGKVLIGSTHGDTCKMSDLPGVMAHDRPEEWGASRFRYWYQGHIHHEDRKEYHGVVVEAFRTLAARDAWHAGQGYRAGRDMRCIIHHREYGEVERHRCDIAMLKGAK